MTKAITNAIVYDFETFYEKGFVLFDETILKVGPMDAFDPEEADTVINGEGHIVMPSFVVAHTHIYSAFARGWKNSETLEGFMDVLEKQWWKLDRAHTLKSIYHSGIVSATDHLRNGVTTLIDHHASGTIEGSLKTLKKAVVDDVGLRGLFCFETSDRFDRDACINENRAFLKGPFDQKTSGHFGLHASLSLSEATLERVKKAKGDHPIHIHVAEGKEDQDDALAKYGERVVKRLDRHGLIGADSILTHALFIDDEERAIIKKREAVVALNPTSNMNNGVGLPDYKKLNEAGIKVILGNDGLSQSITNEYLNLFFTTHLFNHDPQGFGFDDLKKVIHDTYAYAGRRLGIKLGRFKEGYKADLLMHPYTPPTPMDAENALGHLVFGLFASFKPSDVFIDGDQKVKNYKVDPFLHEIYRMSKKPAQTLWHTTFKEGDDA
ncbi:MAG: amidohydrolase family protein [Candidatus Izemoplasmataceae bacterium]